MDHLSGIYRIYNTVNGKSYVGQSQNIECRWKEHKRTLRTNKAKNLHLQRSWNQYGEDSFVFEVLEFCDIAMLNEREQFWIAYFDSFHSGYNMNAGGGGNRGYQWSEESRRRASEAAKIVHSTPENKKAMSERTSKWLATHDNPNGKPVVCVNNGRRFKNSVEAWKYFDLSGHNNITRCCYHEIVTCGEYHGERLTWMFQSEYDQMGSDEISQYLEYVLSGKANYDRMYKRQVVCLNTCEIFDSVKAAARKYNLSDNAIRGCCKHRNSYSGLTDDNKPLIWMYIEEFQELTSEQISDILLSTKPYSETRGRCSMKPVRCLTTGEVFPSIKAAGAAYDVKPGNIGICIREHRSYAGKHPVTGEKLRWEFVQDTTQS